MKSKSISGASTNDIKLALADSQTDGFSPTLAIVFISIKKDRNEISELFLKNGIDIIGATSSGEFINGHQSEGEIVVMLFDIKKENYTLLFEDIGERTIEEAGVRLAQSAVKRFDKPAFILLSTSIDKNGQFMKGEPLIRSIEKVLGNEVNMFGGKKTNQKDVIAAVQIWEE